MEKVKYTKADIPACLAQMALDAQSACNGGALIHGLDRAVVALQDIAHIKNLGTDWVNQHPVVVMFVAQLAHLSSCGAGPLQSNHMDAFYLCEQAAVKEGRP